MRTKIKENCCSHDRALTIFAVKIIFFKYRLLQKFQRISIPFIVRCFMNIFFSFLATQTPKRKLTSSDSVTKGESGEKYQIEQMQPEETSEEFLSQGCTPLPD